MSKISRYHNSNGVMRPCGAQEGNCPLGKDAPHMELTVSQVSEYNDLILAKANGGEFGDGISANDEKRIAELQIVGGMKQRETAAVPATKSYTTPAYFENLKKSGAVKATGVTVPSVLQNMMQRRSSMSRPSISALADRGSIKAVKSESIDATVGLFRKLNNVEAAAA